MALIDSIRAELGEAALDAVIAHRYDDIGKRYRRELRSVSGTEAKLKRLAELRSDEGYMAELVRDGETGRLVPPCDPEALAAAIEELLGSRTLRDRIRRGARAAVERTFDLERNAVAVAVAREGGA